MSRFKPFLYTLVGSATLLSAAPLWADAATTEAPSTAQPAGPTAKTAPVAEAGVQAKTGDAKTGDAKTDQVNYDAAMQKHLNDRKAFMDARLAALRAGLQLTPAQAPLWSPVEDALRDVGKVRQTMHRRAESTDEPAARLKQRGERLIAMGQAMGKLADAAGPLAKSLTPDQRERLPMLLHRIGPRGLLGQLFASADDRGGMRMGEREWRHHSRFADRDGGAWHGFGGRDMDRPDFRDGDRHYDRMRDREGRADDGGHDRGLDRDGPSFRHRHDRDGNDDRG